MRRKYIDRTNAERQRRFRARREAERQAQLNRLIEDQQRLLRERKWLQLRIIALVAALEKLKKMKKKQPLPGNTGGRGAASIAVSRRLR